MSNTYDDLMASHRARILGEPLNTSTQEQSENTNQVETSTEENHTQVMEEHRNSLVVGEISPRSLSRYSSAAWVDYLREQSFTILGLGGIGSNVNYLISKFHPAVIHLVDPDDIEDVNLSAQFYPAEFVGMQKTYGCRKIGEIFNEYKGYVSRTHKYQNISFKRDILKSSIVICGFDNMEARTKVFNDWVDYVATLSPEEAKKRLFIDARLSLEEWQIFAFTGDNNKAKKEYKENWLFKDDVALQEPCSAKQTAYSAIMIASFICNLVVNYSYNQQSLPWKRPLPFKTCYNALNMLLDFNYVN